jgi:hypothetical protein
MNLECGTRVIRGQPGLIGMDVAELRALLVRHQLSTAGTRATLCQRIIEAINRNVISRAEIHAPIQPAPQTTSQPVSQPVPASQPAAQPAAQPSQSIRSSTSPTRRSSSPTQPYVIPPELCRDWHECVQRGTHNGFDVLIIPPNTLLFKGIKASAEQRARVARRLRQREPITTEVTYVGDLPIAAHYAFASDMTQGEQGKIITYRTTQPIILLDMESIRNYQRLSQMNVPHLEDDEFSDILNYTFGYTPGRTQLPSELKRYSDYDHDVQLSQWLCSRDLDGITGYGYLKLPGFHSELLICQPQDKLELYPLEYRFVSYYNPDVVIETFNGHVTGRELTFPQISSREMRVRPHYNTYAIYEPHQDPSDAFLCQEPFVSRRREALIRTADADRPYQPGDELC